MRSSIAETRRTSQNGALLNLFIDCIPDGVSLSFGDLVNEIERQYALANPAKRNETVSAHNSRYAETIAARSIQRHVAAVQLDFKLFARR
jgi:hypothetical protein